MLPNDALDPIIVEYDVDATWPMRPEGISSNGGVAGMAFDGDDNIWVLQRGENPIQIYKPDGTFVRTWGKGVFIGPHQLRIDREGNIWVADFRAHVIQKFTPESELLLTLGTREQPGEDESHFHRPTDMAFTPAGDIFVADRNVGRIQIFDQEGKSLDEWRGIIMPWALTINAKDEILVCGSSPHWWMRDGAYPEVKDQLLMRFTTDGRVRQVWTWPLGVRKENRPAGVDLKPGETIGPHCIAEDSQGNLYIGDIYGERVQKLKPVRERSAEDKAKLLGTE